MIQWHPIETVPKDGTEVLLGHWKTLAGAGTWLYVTNDMWAEEMSMWRFKTIVMGQYPPTHWAEIGEP